MKPFRRNVLPLLTLIIVLTAGLVQEAKGHPCATSFFSALVELIPCRQAVAPFTNWQPTEACCVAVKALGQPCLCVLINGPPVAGVDRSLAMLLPAKCSLNFEPCNVRFEITECKGLGRVLASIMLIPWRDFTKLGFSYVEVLLIVIDDQISESAA